MQAYAQLIAEGWLTGTTGSGTRVADLPGPASAAGRRRAPGTTPRRRRRGSRSTCGPDAQTSVHSPERTGLRASAAPCPPHRTRTWTTPSPPACRCCAPRWPTVPAPGPGRRAPTPAAGFTRGLTLLGRPCRWASAARAVPGRARGRTWPPRTLALFFFFFFFFFPPPPPPWRRTGSCSRAARARRWPRGCGSAGWSCPGAARSAARGGGRARGVGAGGPAARDGRPDRAGTGAGVALQGLHADGYWRQPGGDRPAALIIGYATPPPHAWSRALEALAEVVQET